eukprot:GGOE01011739.1.p1 GENE.GGOE01011739.1~~GGOE01011739.1.p1  ORF type:complete len:273 (+),score=45.71 GGOE01011739.1:39-821(+)
MGNGHLQAHNKLISTLLCCLLIAMAFWPCKPFVNWQQLSRWAAFRYSPKVASCHWLGAGQKSSGPRRLPPHTQTAVEDFTHTTPATAGQGQSRIQFTPAGFSVLWAAGFGLPRAGLTQWMLMAATGKRMRRAKGLKRYDVAIGLSPLGGRGVFALRDFEAGELVEACPTLVVHKDDIGGKLVDYVFFAQDDNYRVLVCGYGMLYNSSRDANLQYVQNDDGDFEYIALRRINKGEELFIDYGSDWWTDPLRNVVYRDPKSP